MRRKSPNVLLAAVVSLMALSALANDIEPTKEFYTVIKAPNPIVVDGDLKEWTGVPVLADPKFYVRIGKEGTMAGKGSGGGEGTELVLFEQYNGGTWTGPDDQTSAVQITYDADNVYFGFVVTDDYHENAANSAWNGDSIQLMIANGDRTGQVALYNYALGGVEGGTGDVIVMHEARPAGGEDTEAVVTRNAATHRTTYEIRLPKSALALDTLEGGTQFGLGMAINDGDQSTPGQKGWGGLGAHAIVFGKTPSETALLTLAKKNDIEPGKEFYTATAAAAPITLDGLLSEWTGVPVLADPKFYVVTGKQGTMAGKGSGGGEGTELILFEEYNGGTWTGPDDQTSAVQITYDAENVYFGFVVTDDYHENAANSAWNGDSIQLMIASADRTSQIALYNYALGGVEGNIGSVIVMHEARPAGGADTEAIITRDATNHKTIYEIKLPASALALETPLSIGTQFGLGMAINDGDQATPGQKGWGGLGAHSIVFGKTPAETALVTLGSAGPGVESLFLSAVNPTVEGIRFRANDRGTSIVAPNTAKATIDGQPVVLVASPKVLDATDFSYRANPLLAVGSHTYTVEVKDTLGVAATDSGTFIVPVYPILTKDQQVGPGDETKRGFNWRVFQNEGVITVSLDQCEIALSGQLTDPFGTPLENYADSEANGVASAAGTVDGPLIKFEIPTVINLSQIADELNGSFTPDGQMPGIPGTTGASDGIDAEIITYVELPAGFISMGVTCDDVFRTQAGSPNDLLAGIVLGESGGVATIVYKFIVEAAGVYPFRTIYQEGAGGAHIEWFSLKSDGTKVLLNDTENGGLKAFRAAGPPALTFSVSIQLSGGKITVTWSEPGTQLQESTDLKTWATVNGATSPYSVTPGARSSVFYRLIK